jgi:hypothetical protein
MSVEQAFMLSQWKGRAHAVPGVPAGSYNGVYYLYFILCQLPPFIFQLRNVILAAPRSDLFHRWRFSETNLKTLICKLKMTT